GGRVRPRLGVPMVLWPFVLPRRPSCAPPPETETEARRRVYLAGSVRRGGWRIADGRGAGVLGQWRQHSQQALRRLTGHGFSLGRALRRSATTRHATKRATCSVTGCNGSGRTTAQRAMPGTRTHDLRRQAIGAGITSKLAEFSRSLSLPQENCGPTADRVPGAG